MGVCVRNLIDRLWLLSYRMFGVRSYFVCPRRTFRYETAHHRRNLEPPLRLISASNEVAIHRHQGCSLSGVVLLGKFRTGARQDDDERLRLRSDKAIVLFVRRPLSDKHGMEGRNIVLFCLRALAMIWKCQTFLDQ